MREGAELNVKAELGLGLQDYLQKRHDQAPARECRHCLVGTEGSKNLHDGFYATYA